MFKKVSLFVFLIFLLALTACSSSQPVQANSVDTQSNAQPSSNGGQPYPPPANGSGQRNSLSARLAAGTLKLEGTNLAVTADQARTLLPLWQKVKTLSADSSTNPADIQAVYQQIQDAMTPDQVQSIQQMSLSQADIQALAQSLGIQITPGAAPNGGGSATLSPDQRATRTAARQTQTAEGTPAPAGFGGRGGGFNRMFLDPLITLLQTRSGG